jgi:hypothetical protein
MEAAVSPKLYDTFTEVFVTYCIILTSNITVQLFAVIVRQLLRQFNTAGLPSFQALQYSSSSRCKGTLCILERVGLRVVQFACYVASPFLLHFMCVEVGDYSFA